MVGHREEGGRVQTGADDAKTVRKERGRGIGDGG